MSGKNPLGNGKEPQAYEGTNVIVPVGGWRLVRSVRAPTANDFKYPIGSLWVDTTTATSYQLVANPGDWTILGSSSVGAIDSLTGDTGGAILGVAGNINVLGTANQITTTGTAGTITASLPAAITAPGSLTTTTTLTGGTGITATTGNIVASTGNITSTLGSVAAATTVTAGTSMAATTTITAGTGLTVTTGGILVSGGDIINSHSDAGTDVTIEVTNSDNTNGASRSGVEIATGGASSGDPYLSFQISGVGASTMTMGLDNSASDLFVISNSGAIGTSNALTLSQAGALTATTSITATLGDITATNGNIVKGTAGNKDIYTSVASTTTAGANSAGTVTLAGGTATISTSAVTASSLIRISRQGIGATGAAALGFLTIGTITASTSFVINSVQAADATALQASDVSVVFWEIVN